MIVIDALVCMETVIGVGTGKAIDVCTHGHVRGIWIVILKVKIGNLNC